MAPASTERVPSPTPMAEELISVLHHQSTCFWARGCSAAWGVGPGANEKTPTTFWVYPFVGRWVWTTPCRGSGLASKHAHRSPIGPYHHGVCTSDHIPLPSDRQGTMSVPVPDCCLHIPGPDIPTTGLAQTLRPTWLHSMDWGALSECNTLWPTHKWLHCS